VEVKVQSQCNLACQYCFIRKNPRDTLAPEAARASLLRARSTGTRRLILTGGEATMRKDLPALIRQAREIGFVDVQLFSNGLMFAYSDVLEACLQAGLSSLCLHISSLDRETYHRLTGRDQLPTLLGALENLGRYPQLEITVLTVVNRMNLGDLAETVARLRTWQAHTGFAHFISQLIFCCIYSSSWDNRAQVVLPMEDALPTMNEILTRHSQEPWPIVHQGFPLCVLPGSETFSYDLYFTLARQLLPAGEIDLTFLDTMFLKPAACQACAHQLYCLGISRGYARLYGSGILKACRPAPVTTRQNRSRPKAKAARKR
jgi:hypothetical protein